MERGPPGTTCQGEGADAGARRAGRPAAQDAADGREQDYLFDGPSGPASLDDLFDGRRQLIVYRFFYQPDVDGWPDKGAPAAR